MTPRGRLIVLEGGEGSGKSTQADRLARRLGALLTREPGGTAIGERIRALVLDPRATNLHPRAEALLLAADRAQHVAEVVEPALARGEDVVSDRFSGSSLAYQGFGRGLDVDEVRRLSSWATGGLEPDVVILLDVPPSIAQARLRGERDRLEAEDGTFHERVAGGFRALARAEPERWRIVDGSGDREEVEARVLAALEATVGGSSTE